MQRIGRINRIGSRSSAIFIYNFLPSEQVEDDIGLQRRAQIKLQAFHAALGEDSQIYSQDEIVKSFGMFDQDITEKQELNERLAYLMEIRQFRTDNPDEFKRIKNLPLKIRSVVEDKTLSGSTLCFLRNPKNNGFYQINTQESVEEMSFLEAVQIFKSHCYAEPIKPLPGSHYKQVQRALAHFMEQLQDKIIKEQQTPELTSRQSTAIHYLSAFLKLDITNADEQQCIRQAIEWVKLGRYQNLPREVIKLQRRLRKTPVVPALQLEAIINIIDKHMPYVIASENDESPAEPKDSEPPRVVISQGYLTNE